jgi:hypothetical protein
LYCDGSLKGRPVLAALTVAALAASFINSKGVICTQRSITTKISHGKPFQYESVQVSTKYPCRLLPINTNEVNKIRQCDYMKFSFVFDYLSKFYPMLVR